MFTHIDEKHVFPQLMRENFEGKRTYVTENGDRYPSITTVLGYKIKPAIKAWRKKVGEQEANKISRQSSVRVTKIHGVCEDYLNNNFDRSGMCSVLKTGWNFSSFPFSLSFFSLQTIPRTAPARCIHWK